jgi:hypothetical protein
MKIELPQARAGMVFRYRAYHLNGIDCCNCVSETPVIDVPEDTYLVICDLQDQGGQTRMSWGYDRLQWAPYQPEYHNPTRLAPPPPEEPKPTDGLEPIAVDPFVISFSEDEEVHLEEIHEESRDQ